jgi:tartrate-resistant acid phosphatase type 5
VRLKASPSLFAAGLLAASVLPIFLLVGDVLGRSSSAGAWAGDHSAAHAPSQSSTVRFAVIGDYGSAGQPEQDVSTLVKSWNPDFMITTGDNNYPDGAAWTIDQNIGQYYHDFIYPYLGSYGAGATENRFFPSLGNHDWVTSGAQPYLDYFTLPGNERYYEFSWGPLDLFAIDSDVSEPDGTSSTSTQAAWLQSRLAASTAPWKLVYMHHPPYSSGPHGSTARMQWPYGSWGADAVMAGHDHLYERLTVEDLPYFVVGLGGCSIYSFGSPVPGSQVRYNADYGAMLVEATVQQLAFRFYSRAGTLIDTYDILSPPVGGIAELPGVAGTGTSGIGGATYAVLAGAAAGVLAFAVLATLCVKRWRVR